MPYHAHAAPPVRAVLVDDIRIPFPNPHLPSFTPLTSPPLTPRLKAFYNTNSTDDLYYSYPRKMSNGRLMTGTSELAEFLKSSKPEDFSGGAAHGVMGSLDDLTLSNPAQARKRRFLRTSGARDNHWSERHQIQPPVRFRPPHVTPKTTSKGSPYLQIQVEYPSNFSNGNQNEKFIPPIGIVETEASVPTTGVPNIYHNIQGNTVGSTKSGRSSLLSSSTSPQELGPPAKEGVDGCQSVGRAYPESKPEPKPKPQRQLPILPPIITNFPSATKPVQVQVRERVHNRALHTPTKEIEPLDRTPPRSTDQGLYPTSTGQYESPNGNTNSHSRTYSQGKPLPQARPHALIPLDQNKIAHADSIQLRKLGKPGPPPNRELPSLPETCDPSASLAYQTVPFQPTQHSTTHSPIEKDSQILTEYRGRQERVRSRKARDKEAVQQRKLQEAIKLLDADVEAKERASNSPKTIDLGCPVAPKELVKQDISSTQASSSIQIIVEHMPEPPKYQHLQLRAHDAPTPPRSPSPLLRGGRASSQARNSPRAAVVDSNNCKLLLEESITRQTELMERLEVMEHKYMVLEQALITVLQRTSPHRSENTSIESLLADFRVAYPCRGWSDAFSLERDLNQAQQVRF